MSFSRQNRYFILFVLLISLICSTDIFNKTTVDTTQNPKFTGVTLSAAEAKRFAKDFQKSMDANGPFFSDSYYLQNVLGYAAGTPHINSFDFGINLGASEANGKYFKGEAIADSYPAVTPIGTLRAGIELSPKSDVLVKLTVFDLFMTGQEPQYKDIVIDDYRQFVIGGKYRYMYLGPTRLLPFLFNFEGLTLGVGGDLLTGYLGVRGEYDNEMGQTNIDPGTGVEIPVDTLISGDYNATMRMLQITSSVEAISYFRVMRFMMFYTGANIALGWSWFGIEADSQGQLKAADDSLDAQIGNGFDYQSDYLLLLDYDSQTIYSPFPLMPVYIAGIEFDIPYVKIGLETAVNLQNRNDVALALNIRYEM
jgi:hypothetical protein